MQNSSMVTMTFTILIFIGKPSSLAVRACRSIHTVNESLESLAERLGQRMRSANHRLITAESCTGGLLAATCTGIPGSSDWFEAGVVPYRLSAKERLLGIEPAFLARFGAVSEPLARTMAIAALERSDADVAVSITGIAGPDGGELDHPVGTVWFCWAVRSAGVVEVVQASQHRFEGDRAQVRESAVRVALNGALETVSESG
jgi:nicotinamide-nucleotide amidase